MRRPMKIPERLPTVRLLTVKEVCKLVGYSPLHLYLLERDGRLFRRIKIKADRK